MYKNYVKDSLTINEYNAKNSSAPDGQQYCNAFCQQYMNIDQCRFYYQKYKNYFGCYWYCVYRTEKYRRI